MKQEKLLNGIDWWISWDPSSVIARNRSGAVHSAATLSELANISGNALVLLGRSAVFLKQLRVPGLKSQEIASMLEIQGGQLFPTDSTELVIGYVDQGVNAANERSVLAIGAMRSQLEAIDRQASERGLKVRGFVPVALGAEYIASEKGALSAVLVEECATGYAIDVVQNGRLVYSRLTPSGASLEAEIHRAGVASGTEPEKRFDCGSNQNPETAFTQLIERGISWPSALIELPERVAARHKKEVAALGRGAALMMIAAALVAYFVYSERAEKASIVENRERAMNNYVQTRTRKSDSIILETNELMTMANEIARATSPGQNASDVLKVISGSTPANLWLSAVSFERGKPFTIRGTALDDASVQTYLANLANLNRFRDVKLVFANNAMIESTSVIQFSISGVAVGNLPPLKTKEETRKK